MKASNALLTAWVVLIAALVAAFAYFLLSNRRTQAPQKIDEVVRPVPPKPGPPETRKPRDTKPRAIPPAPILEISGVVKSPRGEPVEGARVAIFAPTKAGLPDTPADIDEIRSLNAVVYIAPEDWDKPRPLKTWSGSASGEARPEGPEIAAADTNSDGRFRLVLPPVAGRGPFRLNAVKSGVGSATAAEASAGQSLDLTLGMAAAIAGTVVTEVGSSPVEGARVTFDDNARRFAALTGAGGAFRIEGVTPGFYQLSVSAQGQTPLFENRFRVGSNDTGPITLRMPRGTTLRVKAILESTEPGAGAPLGKEPAGSPVPNAQIAVFCEDTFTYVIGRTNAEGVVEFPGMPAGTYALNGLAKGVVALGESQIKIDKNQLLQEESVGFEAAVDTPIQVVDEDGRGVSGVEFFTVNADEKYDLLRSMKIGATDNDGKMTFAFEFDGPRSALFGFKAGYSLVRAYPENYDGGDPIRLVVKKPVKVSGRIKTPDGAGIADAVVVVTIPPADEQTFDDIELELRSDKDGRYSFDYLPRSEGISISATAPDGVSEDDKDLELVAGQNDYTIDMEIDLDEPAPMPQSATPRPPRVPPPMKNPDEGDKQDDK